MAGTSFRRGETVMLKSVYIAGDDDILPFIQFSKGYDNI